MAAAFIRYFWKPIVISEQGEGKKWLGDTLSALDFHFAKPIFFWRKTRNTPPYFDKNVTCKQLVKILLKFPRKNLSVPTKLP